MAAARGPIAAPSPSISSLEIHGDDDAADGMYSRQYSLEEENLESASWPRSYIADDVTTTVRLYTPYTANSYEEQLVMRVYMDKYIDIQICA